MNKIIIVAKYETKMLLRTWKFWILAILGMFFPILMNVAIIIMRRIGEGPGEFHLESTAAYLLFYFYSYAQAIVVIFLASDFREKDKKAKIIEVMSSRPISNFQYIFGKYLGLMGPVIVLALIVVFLSTVLTLIVNHKLIIAPYIFLLLLMNIPALIFITAFIIFISSVVRNSAVVFISICAYMFLIIWTMVKHMWSFNKLYLLLDYGCFFLPMFPSDLVGIVNMEFVLLQRLLYVCLGIFFISISVILYPRLKQSRFLAVTSSLTGIIFLFLALAIFRHFWNEETDRKNIVNNELSAGKEITNTEGLKIKHYDFAIDLFTENSPLQVSTEVTFEKEENVKIETIVLNLNPGLKITAIKDKAGNELAFERKESNIIIQTGNSGINENGNFKLDISYEGEIDETRNFINREENDRGEVDKYDGPWMKENVTHLLREDMVFLFSESHWYPALGKAYGYEYPDRPPVSFFTMNARVSSLPDIRVLTQGDLIEEKIEDTRQISFWETEVPVSKVTLNAGNYTVISDTVRNIITKLYYSPKHEETVYFFKDSAESILPIINDVFYTIELTTGLKYPYKTLSFVETPLQLQWYRQKGIMQNLAVPPGIVMLREELLAASFKEIYNSVKRRAERRKEDLTEEEMRKRVFLRFLERYIFNIDAWNAEKYSNPIQNYWTNVLSVEGKGFPIFEYFLSEYLTDCVSRDIDRMLHPLSREREQIIGENRLWEYEWRYKIKVDTLFNAIRKVPLVELDPADNPNLFFAAMKFKGTRLFQVLKEYLGEEDLKKTLGKFTSTRSYKSSTIEDFITVAEEVSNKELDWFYTDWINGTSFPGYVLENVETFKVRGGKKGITYQVNARIRNGEPYNGFIKVILRFKEDEIVKRMTIDGSKTIEVGFTVNNQPEELLVDPIFARNRRTIRSKISIPERFSKVETWDDIRYVTDTFNRDREKVIDDLDEGFKTVSGTKRKYFRPEGGIDEWNIRETSDAFGKYKIGYRIKAPGRGSSEAIWETDIAETGLYMVYIYMYRGSSWFQRRFKNTTATNYQFTVKHSEGEDTVFLSWKDSAPGWNPVGRFYYKQGDKAQVILSDKANGLLIVDAIKWEFSTNGRLSKK